MLSFRTAYSQTLLLMFLLHLDNHVQQAEMHSSMHQGLACVYLVMQHHKVLKLLTDDKPRQQQPPHGPLIMYSHVF